MVGFAATLVSCVAKQPSELIRVALPALPSSLDPHFSGEWVSLAVDSNIYEGLVRLDPDLGVTPDLAISWTNPDDSTCVFKLRPSVRFHDGESLTAADAAASLMRAKTHPRSAWRGELASVDRVEAPFVDTLVVHTVQPSPTLLRSLAGIAVVPRRLGEDDGASQLESRPVGTGPYRLVSSGASGVRLVRWEGYHGAPPVIREAAFLSIASESGRVDALRSGAADLVSDLSENGAKAIAAAPGCSVLRVRSLRVVYLGFDVARPTTPYASPGRNPFRDRRVRLAVRDAIDAKGIGEALGIAGDAATGFAAPGVFGNEDGGITRDHDLRRAKDLLREAGLAEGFGVVLDALKGVYPGDTKVASLVAESLGAAGIKVELRFEDKSVNFERLTRRDTSFFLVSWAPLGGDVQQVLEYLLHTPDPAHGYGSDNCGGYSDPALDHMIEEAGRTVVEHRAEKLRAAVQAAMFQLPLVPLYVPNNLYGIRASLRWTPRRDKIVRLEEIGVRP